MDSSNKDVLSPGIIKETIARIPLMSFLIEAEIPTMQILEVLKRGSSGKIQARLNFDYNDEIE